MNKPECPICMNPISKPFYAHGDNGLKHPFHKACLMKHIKDKKTASCPVCRKNLSEQNMISINRPNNNHNNSNKINGVTLNEIIIEEIDRNNLGISPRHVLQYIPEYDGYVIVNQETQEVLHQVNARFYNGIVPDNHIVTFNANSNTHFIVPRHD